MEKVDDDKEEENENNNGSKPKSRDALWISPQHWRGEDLRFCNNNFPKFRDEKI